MRTAIYPFEEPAMNALEWNEAALAKYLATHPTLKDEISSLSPEIGRAHV